MDGEQPSTTHSDVGSLVFRDEHGYKYIQCSKCGFWMSMEDLDHQLTRRCSENSSGVERWTEHVMKQVEQGKWMIVSHNHPLPQPTFIVTSLW